MDSFILSLKKNLVRSCQENPDWLLFFFDESRFGTHSKLGHGWFPKGSRTQVHVKLGFKNFYLYSAVNPHSGEDFTLIAPNVNTKCMNVFLEHMSRHLGCRKVIMVMDCAGWHKSKSLVVPPNIRIMHLPPYSPELNPVERFWQYIKQHTIKNRVYETLETLEEAVSNFIKNLEPNCVASICNVTYL